jgi:hypothetical protein
MMRSTVGRRFFEALLFAVSSLVLYSFGVARVLFLVPLQAASVHRRTAGIASAGGIAVAALAAIRLAGLFPAPFAEAALLACGAEVALFLLLVAGLLMANLRLGRARAPLRLLAATGAVCLAGSPLVAALAASPAAVGRIDELIATYSRMAQAVFATTGDTVMGTLIAANLVPEELKKDAIELLRHSFVLWVFALLAFSWWAGSAAGRRADAPSAPRWRFAAFRLEGWWLWPLIASLALVAADFLGLAGRVPGPGSVYVSGAAWNAALVMLFLFGLQGLAILRFWLEKRGVARFLWPLVVLAVLAALATPQLSAVIAVVLPLFGASENWVRYRSGGAAAT